MLDVFVSSSPNSPHDNSPQVGRVPRIAPRSSRLWVFRFVAILVGCLPFVLLEGACLFCGWGAERDYAAAFVPSRPLFALSSDASRYEIPVGRQRFFRPESFPAVKAANAFRIFVVGESTVAGEPFGKETSFTTWLKLSLEAGDRSREWEVVNCGGISYASYRLTPIVAECLAYSPDLIVLAVGHNEFLEERRHAPLRESPALLRSLQEHLSVFRSYRLLQHLVHRDKMHGSAQRGSPRTEEVAARLDFQNGLATYHRDDAGRSVTVDQFARSLDDMVCLTKQAGVPMILIRQPSNLADCPPFKSEHASHLSENDLECWGELISEAHSRLGTDLPDAIRKFEQALAIDPQFAQTLYELGKCYEATGDLTRARDLFVRARDEDICPLRMISPLEKALEQIARDEQIPLVDAQELLEARTRGILGDYWLVDHVHPSIAGHQVLAERLADELESQGLFHPSQDSPVSRDASFAAHLDGLDPLYFLRGERTLQALRGWAAGRAEEPPPAGVLQMD